MKSLQKHRTTPDSWESKKSGGFLTVSEVCGILSCTPQHVVQLIKTGRLEGVNIAATRHRVAWRVRTESLMNFITRNAWKA